MPLFVLSTAPIDFKDLGTVRSAASHPRDQRPCLSRRLDHPGRFTRTESSAYQSNHSSFTNFGMDYQSNTSGVLLIFSHQCPFLSLSVHGHACMQDNLYNQSDLSFCPIYPSRMLSSRVPAVLDKKTLVTTHTVLGHSDPTGYGIYHTSTMVQLMGSYSRSPITFPRAHPVFLH